MGGDVPQSNDQLRVVIADDHPVYRQGLARMLERSGIEVAGEAPHGEAAIEVVAETAPDVALVDLNMPRLSGIEVTRVLGEISPSTGVLVLTVSALEDDVTAAILAGASGYILKEEPIEEVVAGIRAVAAGDSRLSPRIASMLLARIRERSRGEFDLAPVELSEREIDVLRLVADGKPNQEIGDELYIGSSTVRHHVSNILMKMQVDNRVQAAVHAVRNKML